MTFEDLHSEALKLGPEAKANLAHDLIVSLGDLSPEGVHNLWLAEAERRDTEMVEGRVRALPGDEVLARLRARHS